LAINHHVESAVGLFDDGVVGVVDHEFDEGAYEAIGALVGVFWLIVGGA
jgi:hypothetical protein